MKYLILSLLFLSTLAFGKPVIKLDIYTFNEQIGKELLKRQHEGYAAWERAGWKEYFDKFLNKDARFLKRNKLGKCLESDIKQHTFSPCMAGAMVHSMQQSIYNLGIDVDFDFSLAVSDYANIDYRCQRQGNCMANAIWDWGRKGDADVELLLMPIRNASSYGRTHTLMPNGDYKPVMALLAGAQQPYALLHLFRHEMAHAMGFNYHLYDTKPIVWNADKKLFPKCEPIEIKPYSQSGLTPDCKHRTFLGQLIPQGAICTKLWMGSSHFHDGESFNVQVYGPIFKKVFDCYIAEYIEVGESPKPQPEPDKEDKPTPDNGNWHKYCPIWLDLVKQYQCK